MKRPKIFNHLSIKGITLLGISALLFCQSANGQTYCTPSYNNGCSSGNQIKTAYLAGETTTLNNNNSGCSTNAYGDFTSTTNQPDLIAGDTYKLVLTIVNNPLSAYNYVAAWIDYNNDDSFETSERFIDPNNEGRNVNGTDTFSFTVPAMAQSGLHRMRIRLLSYPAFHPFLATITPCNTLNYGETEDYDINVLTTSANDAGIDSLISPDIDGQFCSGSKTVKVRLTNIGTNNLHSVHIDWSVNNIRQTAQSLIFSPPLNTNEDTIITLGNTNFPFQDTVSVKAWTSQPNNLLDGNPGNDTLTVNIIAIGGTAPSASGISDSLLTEDSLQFSPIAPQHVSHFLWLFGDNQQSTDSITTHKYDSAGNYTVSLIISNDCGSDTITKNVTISTTGISILHEPKPLISVYPNPTNDFLILSNQGKKTMTQVIVYDVLGRKILQKNLSNQLGRQFKLQVNTYSPGIYSLRIRLTSGVWINKKFEVKP